MKFNLETKSLQAFVDDFQMTVLYSKKIKESKDVWGFNHIIRYKHKIHLLYKPTSKCIIIPYTHGVFVNESKLPAKKNVIHSLVLDAYLWYEGEGWSDVQDENGNWCKDYSYQNYCNSHDDMVFKDFVAWRNEVKKLKIILGDRFNKFIEFHNED
jgi:hypothetical protein